MGITWEEAEVAAQNSPEWRRSVAQCIHFKVKVKVTYVAAVVTVNSNLGGYD